MVKFKNDIRWGMFIGLLSPLSILVSYYYAKFYPVPFFSLFFHLLLTEHQFLREIATGFLMLSGFLFFLFVNSDKTRTATGIFIVTLVLGLSIFLINVLFAG